jgi:hypothetical protein
VILFQISQIRQTFPGHFGQSVSQSGKAKKDSLSQASLRRQRYPREQRLHLGYADATRRGGRRRRRRRRRRIRAEPRSSSEGGQRGCLKVNIKIAIDQYGPKRKRALIFSCRVRNCILALAANGVMLWDTTLIHAYDVSIKYSLTELLKKSVMRELASLTKQQIEMET